MENSGAGNEESGESVSKTEGPARKREFSIRMPRRNTLLVIAALIIIMSLAFQVRMMGFYNPDGNQKWPYLRNVDSYSYYADVESMLRGTGSFSIGSRLYQIVTYFGYRLFGNPEITSQSLTHFFIWWPAFLISLAAVPAYFIGRYLYDRKAGVLSAFFIVMSPNIASRTLAGDPDSDVFIITISLLSLALFAIALRKFDASKLFTKANVMYPVFTGMGVALFALTWPGYWFVFMIILGTIVLKIIIGFARHRIGKHPLSDAAFSAKPWLSFLLVFFVGFWIITIPILGFSFIYNPFSQLGVSADLFGGGGIKSESGSFPNVYVSVAEMQPGGQAGNIINSAAGLDIGASASGIDAGLLGFLSPFVFVILSFVYLVYSYVRKKQHLDALLVLGLWMIGMVYSAITAVRFGIFLAPAIAISSTIILSKIWNLAFSREEVSK